MSQMDFHEIREILGGEIRVERVASVNGETAIEGNFGSPMFSELSQDQKKFLMDFVMESGSLKGVAERRDVSYPTVRRRLDEIIEELE